MNTSRDGRCTEELQWHQAKEADLPTIAEIAKDTHLTLPERPEVFAEKLRLFPAGCRVLVHSGEIVGYGVSHPWQLYSIPPLDTFLRALPASPGCIFIHDLAVLPRARGHGAAEHFMEIVAAVARERHIPTLAGVSVYGTHRLWMKCGAEVIDRPELAEKIRSYGETARYMVCRLP